ncbi:Threonine/homoserine efflux transporter RhtA [Paracidovorax anthurii]|uniref:Threonine/homoserine efflux transporter RhtA n=2 Tax=Paracidovorax anthurii TaxID=78229 RepID=A0A328YTH5_9BURK|nr:DMT family transporter [Paracidovorax anthurii]RAR77311.1 threonine/homoserine efflux transporter RhtA [Paracidovorax anthurii]
MTLPAPFPRRFAIGLLLLISCTFAANHVAARLAFDHGTGLLLAVLCRSGATALVLAALVAWKRPALAMAPGALRWQLLLGALVATQSLCLYSAVARIPVALALLVSNVCPVLLALLTWALGGPRPTRRAAVVMAVALCGLLLALDIPGRVARLGQDGSGDWMAGIAFAFTAACVFAVALWVTDHKLKALPGMWRSLMTVGTVFALMVAAGVSGLVPGGMQWPGATPGWWGLAALVVLYGTAFTAMFVSLPRMDMARNAPVMNIEPVATLLLGWWVLEQTLQPLQLVGGAVVLAGIVLLSRKG